MYKKFEQKIEDTATLIVGHPKKVIFIILLCLMIPFMYIHKMKMDTSIEGLMHDNDPVLVAYNKFREVFGRDEKIIIGIKTDDVYTLEFFKILRDIHRDIESQVPYIEEVTSLYNVRNTRGEGDQLLTDDLLSPFPMNAEAVERIKEVAASSHFFNDLFVSREHTMAALVIETDTYSHIGERTSAEDYSFDDDALESGEKKNFLSEAEDQEIIRKIRSIVKTYQERYANIDFYIAGSPVISSSLISQLLSDMMKFTSVVFLLMVAILYFIFRRTSAVVYSLLITLLAMLATIGLMGWSGVSFKLPTQILPSLLLAVSVGASVHVFSVFFDRFDATGNKKESIIYTLRHSGLAICMTSFTTAVGVGSFVTSELAPISDLGVFGSFGILISLFLTLILLPALLSITPLKSKSRSPSKWLNRFMHKLAHFSATHVKSIIGVSFLLIGIALFAASKIELSHNMINWFPSGHTDRVSTHVIDEAMHGSITLEVVIDSGVENGWKEPQRLEKLGHLALELERYVDEHSYIGKVISLDMVLKETNRALHGNDENFYTVPEEQNLVSQELLLFENSGSDDLKDVVDTQFRKTRMTIKLPWTDAVQSIQVLNYTKAQVEAAFPDDAIEVTGMMKLLINTFTNSVHSSVRSYLLAFVAITLFMMLIFGSVRIGLISMIPNFTPIILGLFVMYITKIPLDMFTLLIGSIAIGLAVDDTIHFMHNYRKYYHLTGKSEKAIEHTFLTAGKALVITTLVLSGSFYAYMMAEMTSIQNFGFLTGTVIIFALLADILLAPALMVVVSKWRWLK